MHNLSREQKSWQTLNGKKEKGCSGLFQGAVPRKSSQVSCILTCKMLIIALSLYKSMRWGWGSNSPSSENIDGE